MRTLVYGEFLTSADTDILVDTPFAFVPGDGVVIIRAASTVNTATLAVKASNHPEVSEARAITFRANGEILETDPAWIVPVEAGEKITAALAGTTGTVQFRAQYVGS